MNVKGEVNIREPKEQMLRGRSKGGESPKMTECDVGPGGQLMEVAVTCTVDGLVPLERTLTQGSDPGHGPA